MSGLHVGAAKHTRAGIVRFGKYPSGEIAMQIVSGDGVEGTATVSLVPYGAPDPGTFGVYLKGWSENEGIPEALVAAGIVKLTGDKFPTGYVEALHAELTERARIAFLEQP